MGSPGRRVPALILIAVATAACGDQTTAPAAPVPASPTPASSPTPLVPPTATPSASPPPNQRPVGELRFTPDIGIDGDIHIRIGGELRVNASRFRDPDGDPLFLTVSWGDGFSNHIQCGLCRLAHVYRKRGAFRLRAEVTDLKTRPVANALTVQVE
jgi:hypothetical protein